MKKTLISLGYKFTDKDDLTNKQFSHITTDSEIDEEISILGNIRNVYMQIWQLSLDKADIESLVNQLESINFVSNNDALYPSIKTSSKSFYLFSYDVSLERQENRYLATITFNIKED